MNPFVLATDFILIGLPMWIVGNILRKRAEATAPAPAAKTKSSFAGTLYFMTCISCLVVWLYLDFLEASGVPVAAAFKVASGDALAAIGSITSDPILLGIVYIILGFVAICLVPGAFMLAIYFAGLVLALAFVLALVVLPLVSLAQISPGGAVLAALITLVPLIWLVRKCGRVLARVCRWALEPAYGMFFDWWLTPLIRRRKERRIMDELENKRSQCEAVVLRLREQYPEAVADMGGSPTSDTWLERTIERFHDRDRQKSIAERTRLVALAKQYFTEYRAMLDAHDELNLAARDAGLRRLKRQKEELALQHDIADLQELRPVDRETQVLTKRYELEQLKRKMGGAEDGPYKQGMREKKARRIVDIEDQLFEALEHPIQTEVEARVLYKKLRRQIDRYPDLSDPDKDDLQERLKERFTQLFKTAASTAIFEDD